MGDGMHVATCQSCGRSGEVPEVGRTYRCKTCGGEIVVDGEPRASDPLEGMKTCPACSMLSPAGLDACSECGSSLGGEQEYFDMMDRMVAGRALGKARRDIRTMRRLFAMGATWFLVQLLVVQGGHGLEGAGADSRTSIMGVLSILVVVFVVGAWQVVKDPRLWSLVLAVIWTLMTTLSMIASTTLGWSLPSAFFGALQLGVAGGLWVYFRQSIKIRQLMTEYPDLWLGLKAHHRREGHESIVRERVYQRHHKPANKRPFVIAACSVVVLVAAGWTVWYQATRPPDIAGAVIRFSSAWNASRHDDVLSELQSSSMRGQLTRLLARRGWSEDLPRVGEPTVEMAGAERATGRFPCDGDELTVRWTLEAGLWTIASIRPPSARR